MSQYTVRHVIIATGFAAVAFVFAAPLITAWRGGGYDPWSQLLVPASAQVLQTHVAKSGLDRSDAICVSYADDSFIDQTLSTFDLDPVQEPTSFVSLRPPLWWKVDNLAERYGRTDDEAELYWSCWVDREKRLLFLERGKW